MICRICLQERPLERGICFWCQEEINEGLEMIK